MDTSESPNQVTPGFSVTEFESIERALGRPATTCELNLLSQFWTGQAKPEEDPEMEEEIFKSLDAEIAGLGLDKPLYFEKINRFNPRHIASSKNYKHTAWKLLEQMNHVDTAEDTDQFQAIASIIHLNSSQKTVVLCSAYSEQYIHANPRIGGMILLANATRKISCMGAKPKAFIQSPFQNPAPILPGSNWTYLQMKKGIQAATQKLRLKDFTKNKGQAVEDASPPQLFGVCMIGIFDEPEKKPNSNHTSLGDQLYMIGTPRNDIGSSKYVQLIHETPYSPTPFFDLEEEISIQFYAKVLRDKQWVKSVHSICEGGLFAALIVASLHAQVGFDIDTDSNFTKDAYLFGESQSRILISVPASFEDEMVVFLNARNVAFSKLGIVTVGEIRIDGDSFGQIEEWKPLFKRHFEEIPDEGS